MLCRCQDSDKPEHDDQIQLRAAADAAMTAQQDTLKNYPSEVRAATKSDAPVYKRLPGHYAVHRQQSAPHLSKNPIATMNEGETRIEVYREDETEVKHNRSQPGISPVYALHSGGTPAVPTGRIFVRAKEGDSVETLRQKIEQAGYRIVQILNYAPHAAWLQASSGSIAEALTGIHKLEKIAEFENIEPQMLMPRANR